MVPGIQQYCGFSSEAAPDEGGTLAIASSPKRRLVLLPRSLRPQRDLSVLFLGCCVLAVPLIPP